MSHGGNDEEVLKYKAEATTALQAGDIESACALYEQAVHLAATLLSSNNTQAATAGVVTKELVGILFSNLSLCHFKLGHLEEALRDAVDSSRIHPRYPKSYYRAAQALHALGRFEEAEGMVAKGLVYVPDSLELRDLRKEIKLGAKVARIEASRAGELGAVLVKGPGIYEDHTPIIIVEGKREEQQEGAEGTDTVVVSSTCPLLAAVGVHIEILQLPSPSISPPSAARLETLLVCETLQQAEAVYQQQQQQQQPSTATIASSPSLPQERRHQQITSAPQLNYPFLVQGGVQPPTSTSSGELRNDKCVTYERRRVTKAEVHALIDFIQCLCVSVDDGETPAVAAMMVQEPSTATIGSGSLIGEGDAKQHNTTTAKKGCTVPMFTVPTCDHIAEWQVSYNLLARQPLAASPSDIKAGVFVDLIPVRFVDVPDVDDEGEYEDCSGGGRGSRVEELPAEK